MSDLQYFARIAGDNPFRQWLEKERESATKYLTEATDTVQIHRAQGKVLFINGLLSNLEKAKEIR